MIESEGLKSMEEISSFSKVWWKRSVSRVAEFLGCDYFGEFDGRSQTLVTLTVLFGDSSCRTRGLLQKNSAPLLSTTSLAALLNEDVDRV